MGYIQYVNIKQGSDSVNRFSNGNTLPLVQQPFGFAAFVPQGDASRGGWFYHPTDHCFEGFRLTHQPSPWIGEHGAIVMQPQIQSPVGGYWGAWSGIDPKAATLQPHYMHYYLKRSFCDYELTPTNYGACIRMTFHKDFERYLSIFPVQGEHEYKLCKECNKLFVSTTCDTFRSADKGQLKTYIVYDFEDGAIDFENTIVENPTEKVREKGHEIKGENVVIHLALNNKQTVVKMATSFISFEQALVNLKNDSTYESFEDLKAKNEAIWEEYLGKITIEADEDRMKTFYSCMHRAFCFPHKAYEINAEGKPVHYAPACDKVCEGYRYTDNGFWDTYRTVYAFYTLVAPQECKEMLTGYIQDYIDGGWLPCWTAGTEKKCMPSTGIDAIIADAAVKGMLDGDLLKTAFEGMEKHANNDCPIAGYGRDGCSKYLELGYVPYDAFHESVNLTLDAAYFDYCLAVVADKLGYQDKKEMYLARAKRYQNLFDKETGFMRAKDSNGNFRTTPFSPIAWGGDYTEAAAWQTSFAVQHDIEGLAELHGGKDALLKKLDDFFAAPVEFLVGGYGFEIHEMTEMAADNWGQCAISNQPSFHIPFMYAYLGQQDKADYWLDRICKEGFSANDDGYPGDEDNGTTAIWYVFANIGLYPICPGKAEYTITKQMVKNIKVLGKELDLSDCSGLISHDALLKKLGL